MKNFRNALRKFFKRCMILLLIATVCYIFAEFAPSARVKLPNFYWAIDKLYAVLDWLFGLLRQLIALIGKLFGQAWQ